MAEQKFEPVVRTSYEIGADGKIPKRVEILLRRDLVEEFQKRGYAFEDVDERYQSFTFDYGPEEEVLPPIIVDRSDDEPLEIEMRGELFDLIEGAKLTDTKLDDESYCRLEEIEPEEEYQIVFALGADAGCYPMGV
jgi:hypothetical protein